MSGDPLKFNELTPAIAVIEMGNLYPRAHGIAALVIDENGNAIFEWRVNIGFDDLKERRREMSDKLIDLAVSVRDGGQPP